MTGLRKGTLISKSVQVFGKSIASLCYSELMGFTNIVRKDDCEYIIYLLRPSILIINCKQKTIYRLTGKREGKVLSFRDVTHEIEVDAMATDFLLTADHELRTLLAIIYGFSELLMARDFDKNTPHDMIVNIHRQLFNLKRLLDKLLDLSRIEERVGRGFIMVKKRLNTLLKNHTATLKMHF